MLLSRTGEGNAGVFAVRDQFLFVSETILRPPELATGISDQQIQPATIRQSAHLGLLDLRFCQFHENTPSPKEIPPEVHPLEAGFHRTPLDVDRLKTSVDTGGSNREGKDWTLLDVFGRGSGGETGIRTLDTLRYTRFPSVRP